MIDIAQKYTDTLKIKFLESTYDDRYKYYNPAGWNNEYVPSTSTWDMHEFVSVHNEEVIGYIAYSIDRTAQAASGLKAINFSNNKTAFGFDLATAVKEIFDRFNFNKLSFAVIVGNPIERSYDRLTLSNGGRIVGTQLEEVMLADGKMYDYKLYEILKKDYNKAINDKLK